MADTPSILSARLTRWQREENRDAGRPLVRHFLYVPLPGFRCHQTRWLVRAL